MFSFALLSTFAAVAYAAPSLVGRQNTGPCAGLGGLSVTDNASNFTLAALNITLPNTNSSGAPLVIASNTSDINPTVGAIGVLATYASFPDYSWPGPILSLGDGTLATPQVKDGFFAIDVNVTTGYGLGFEIIPNNALPYGPPIYCIQDDGAPSGLQHGILAVFGDTDDFSLCTTISDTAEQAPLNQVIYKASADNNGEYDYNSCYAVHLQVIY